jgi:Transposase
MRLKEYGRNPKMRKVYIQQPGLLLVGGDVSKAKPSACIGTQTNVRCRKLDFPHTREGFKRFEQTLTLREHLLKSDCRRLLLAMDPSGIYGQGLSERLRSCGYDVCLVSCQAGHNNRQTMPEGLRKTDAKDAYSVWDVLRQGKCLLPVARDAALKAAYRVMRRSMARKNRVRQLRKQWRATIHLTFPALHPMRKDLTQPTARRFLQANPTPESLLRNGRRRFREKWHPRRRCGQWRPEKCHPIYDWPHHASASKTPTASRRLSSQRWQTTWPTL